MRWAGNFRDISSIVVTIEQDQGKHLRHEENIPRQLTSIQESLISFIKGITHHQRIAETHILVLWRKKNKTLCYPLQCIPFKGLGDIKICNLANTVIQEMMKRNMKVAGTNTLICTYIIFWIIVSPKGFTTDDEWNTLRRKGNIQPLSVFQIRCEARAKYSQMNYKRWLQWLLLSVRSWL